ncbi:hypothetical protein KTI96_02205 [Acinetobacter bereziniae]|nr:hypothetical protein [Acinetobacter bereziniae]
MNQSFQDSKHKFIALYYGGFSIFAICILIYLIDFNNINLFSKLIYGLMLTQLIITLYAAYQYWQLNITGLKILKWISFSLIFLLSTPLFLYIPNIAIIFGFFIEWTDTSFFSTLKLHAGYNTTITLNGDSPWGFGLNFIEFFMFYRFRKILNNTQIPLKEK